MISNDPIGIAARKKLNGYSGLNLTVESNICEDDIIPVDYLFRTYNEMPKLEKYAIQNCRGKILDIGSGVGSHSLFLQQKHDVVSIEISNECCKIQRERGLKKVVNKPFFDFSTKEKFDTILLMMNGIGIVGNVNNLNTFFIWAKKILNPNGQIIFDSSDISYLFDNTPKTEKYYGEVNYNIKFENFETGWFNWLFIDFNLIKEIAQKNGFKCEKIIDGDHFDYTAKLRLL